MDPTLSIILAILSSLLSFLLASLFQLIRDDRDRKWKKEDFILQRRLEVLNLRLEEVEDYMNELFDIMDKMREYETKLIHTRQVDKSETFYIDYISAITKASKKSPSVPNIDDEELSIVYKEFVDHILVEEINAIGTLEDKIDNNLIIDNTTEYQRLAHFVGNCIGLRDKVRKRINQLSGFH